MHARYRQRTSQAPLTNLFWSKTYMGSVSQRLLVRLTRIPLASISLHACSIIATRSPRLLPKAMYAVCLGLRAPAHPQASRNGVAEKPRSGIIADIDFTRECGFARVNKNLKCRVLLLELLYTGGATRAWWQIKLLHARGAR